MYKPILFNTEMVRAILDGRKNVTRRMIKLPQCGYFGNDPPRVKLPYKVGDILYVRETWCEHPKQLGKYYFKANSVCDGKSTVWGCPEAYSRTENCDLCEWFDGWIKWKPSIHMPKEVARIFLSVTDVRVERLQEISFEQIENEGIAPYNFVSKVNRETARKQGLRLNMMRNWNSTIKKADLGRYGWNANPWVWVIEFERVKED